MLIRPIAKLTCSQHRMMPATTICVNKRSVRTPKMAMARWGLCLMMESTNPRDMEGHARNFVSPQTSWQWETLVMLGHMSNSYSTSLYTAPIQSCTAEVSPFSRQPNPVPDTFSKMATVQCEPCSMMESCAAYSYRMIQNICKIIYIRSKSPGCLYLP